MNATQKRRLPLDRRLEVIEYFVDPAHSHVVAFLEEIKRQLAGGATSVALAAKQSTAPTVFVSASMKDSEIVRRLTGFLRERGFVPWAAADEIQAGDDLRQRIGEALAAADCVIVLFSAHSAESAWVRYEAEAAMVREVTGQTVVLPVVVGDFGDANLPAYFRNRFYLRLPYQFTSDDLQPVLAALTRITRERWRPGENDRARL